LPHIGEDDAGTCAERKAMRLALGRGLVQAGSAHALDQAALRVRALVPRVHRVEHLVGLVDHQHRPGGEHVELRVGDQRRDLDHAVGVRLQAGHLHVDPDEVVRGRRPWLILA
jgi:hypothetical protein